MRQALWKMLVSNLTKIKQTQVNIWGQMGTEMGKNEFHSKEFNYSMATTGILRWGII